MIMNDSRRSRTQTYRVALALTLVMLLSSCGGTASAPAAETTQPAAATAAASGPAATEPAATTMPEAAATEPAATTAPEAAATEPAATTAPEAATEPAEAAATEPAATTATGSAPAAALPESVPARNEAPTLAEQVKAGTLPPLAERVPAEPLTIPVLERIGEYGGDWSSGILGGSDAAWVGRTVLYDGLVRWNPEWTEVIPNIAKSWEVSADGTTYTFELREGMKWSDGESFTSADILFWAEDIAGNEELSPSGQPGWMKVNGEPAEITAPDEYTVVFKFGGPNGLFLQHLATTNGLGLVDAQAKYAKQFHPKYNPEAPALAEQAKLPGWVELFQNKVTSGPGGVNARVQNTELPTLAAWRLTNPINAGQNLVYERNPYYWKVDPEGNQLPYLDRVVYPLVEDVEVLTLKALNGEVDMMDRHIGTVPNKAVFMDQQEQGDYRFFETISAGMNTTSIAFNLTHKDPVKREIFNNRLFRQALSVAINRQEIIDLVFVGQGQPSQVAPRPESEFYNEEMATQYTEFDPEQAAQWLDEAGYTAGPDGKRLGPDGKPIVLSVEVPTGFGDRVDVMELVVGYWEDIGIDAQVVVQERALFYTRKAANDHDVGVFEGNPTVMLDPRWFFPYSEESIYGIAWQAWFNNPQDELAEEPPAETKRQMELYEQLTSTPDPEEQAELFKQIIQIAQEQFYSIGVSTLPNGYGIVKNNFHNVPGSMPNAFVYNNPGPTRPEQYFKSGQ